MNWKSGYVRNRLLIEIPNYDKLTVFENQLKVIYNSKGAFNLRDFHHAVNSMFVDPFSSETNMFELSPSCNQGNKGKTFLTIDLVSISKVSCLEELLTDEGLYSWFPHTSNRKVIMLSSCFIESDESFQKTVRNAADHSVAIEFVQVDTRVHPHALGEDITEHLLSEKNKKFATRASEFKNCLFLNVKWDLWSFQDLVKWWLHDMSDDESIQADILFKINIVESTNKIICDLYPSIVEIKDKFRPSQICRCHGMALNNIDILKQREKKPVCPVTGHYLDDYDLSENGINIGDETVLLLPSFKKIPQLESGLATVELNVIQCVRLDSLHEGLLFGSACILMASSNHDIDILSETEVQTERNTQIFSGLCQVLDSRDCGLICTSNCDIEYMSEASLPCFYLLQPSKNGSMLIRRITSAEEYLPFRKAHGASHVSEKLIDFISSSLEKMGFHDYNPLDHERGCHSKLNWLVKESLQFRTISTASSSEVVGELNSNDNSDQNNQFQSEIPRKKVNEKKNKSPSQLVREQIPSIIQRMEPLKALNKSQMSLSISNSESQSRSQHHEISSSETSACQLPSVKKPLIPFQTFDSNMCISPKLKPNFRRIKRSRN